MKIEKLTTWSPIGAYVTSGDGEDDKPDCALVLYLFRWYMRMGLPQIVRPESARVVPNWDVETIARLGRDYYISYTKREYGFLLSDGHLSVYLGRQTDDSSTEMRWSCFLPWTQWRFVRHSIYGLSGEHVWTQLEANRKRGIDAFVAMRAEIERLPKRVFSFNDFDGELIEATTHIEEREWHFGTGWFEWLSWFRAPKIRRSLDINFSKETGPKKRSWKGGTLGHGIGMLDGELHEAAFRRYCIEHKMTFRSALQVDRGDSERQPE